jgi:diguanylate cyclase (GGDEF)-like protein
MIIGHRHSRKILVVGLILALAFMTLMCFFCVMQTTKRVTNQSREFLGELSSHEVQMTDSWVESLFQSMTNCSLLQDQTLTREEKLNNLRKIVEGNGYECMSVVEKDDQTYTAYTTDGKTVALAESETILKAFNGQRSAAPKVLSGLEDSNVIDFFLPVYQNGAVGWVLELSVSNEQLRKVLNVESFQGKGYSMLIDANGDKLLCSEQVGAENDATNWFQLLDESVLNRGYSVEQVKSDLAAGKSGLVYYQTKDGVDKTVNYQAIQSNGWYLLSVMPSQVENDSVNGFVFQLLIAVGSIFVLFCGLVAFIVRNEKQNSRDLENLAFQDSVTGGKNRTYFEMFAFHKLMEGEKKALVFTNIKGFKWVNDMLGKATGDLILRELDGIITRNLQRGEVSGRLGGDNFALVLDLQSGDSLEKRLSVITQKTRSIASPKGTAFGTELSCGVYYPEEGMDLFHMLDRAKLALIYGEKISKEEIRVYNDGIRKSILRERELTDKMYRALDEHHFEVFFQPKYELKEESVSGAEALIRWRDPDEGMIYPNEFIPLFERNGFVVEIDLFVFEETCRLLQKWRNEGHPMVPISVNVTKRSLDSGDFPNRYWEVWQKYQVSGKYLEFEFTERLFYGDFAVLSEAINRIHSLGGICAIDDFGSGYSSLNMLKSIKADVLKMDGAFFHFPTQESMRGYQVVSSVVGMGKSLGMQIVAEGIETREQVDVLKQLDCDLVQGYVFAKPMCCEEFEELLAKTKTPDPELHELQPC